MPDTDPASRDYLTEMNLRIAQVTEGSGWASAETAWKLHAQLLETDPDLLDGWLHASAIAILGQAISGRERHRAAYARSAARNQHFSDAAARANATGDYTQLSGMFSISHVIDDRNTRKRAADMNGADHDYVASGYHRRAEVSAMLGSFHRAVARHVGDLTTADVYTEDQYEEMYRSIVRGNAQP